jgi:solute carrier family 35 (UDP-xylose/UDP-N-acetylglucosamine transporter), member B4
MQTAVIIVSVGVILATLSRPTAPKISFVVDPVVSPLGDSSGSLYVVGISMLALSLVLSGILGALQEQTFAVYGPHWQEGIFYTVSLDF